MRNHKVKKMFTIASLYNEFAKLRAFPAHVPYVPTCLRAYVPTCLRAYVPYVPMRLRCLRAYLP